MRRLRARILLFLFSALSLTLLLGLPKDDAPVVGVGLARQPAAKWSAGAAENATTSLALAKAAARGPVTSIAFLPEVYLMQTGNNKVPEVPCANVATVNGLVHTCCEGPSLGRGSRAAGRGVCCLPSIIVGGTQKSGSTAMSALLLQHPNVRFADRKEVHFFSMARSFTRGLDNYMSHFSVRRMPGTEQRLDHFVTAEATPFYLHSPDACRFISYTVPSAKLIFILRDPTARAYSEYQMKVRRIEEGATLSSAMQQHRGPFLSCLARFGLVDTMQFIECLPEAITSAAKWKGNAKRVLQRMGLIARPRKQPAAPSPIEELPPGEAPPLLSFTPEEKTDLGTLASLTARCFRHVGGQRLGEAELTAIIKNPAAGPRRRLGLNASADEEGMELPRKAPGRGGGPGDVEGFNASRRREAAFQRIDFDRARVETNAIDDLECRDGTFQTQGVYKTRREVDCQWERRSRRGLQSAGTGPGPGPRGTATQYGGRGPGDNGTAAGEEDSGDQQPRRMQEAPRRKGAGKGASKDQGGLEPRVYLWDGKGDAYVPELGKKVELKPDCLLFLEEKVGGLEETFKGEMENIVKCEEGHFGRRATTPAETLQALKGCSLNPTPGITRQFVYRSLYPPQLSRCFRHLKQEQVLVLSSDELREDMDSALEKMHAFTGLPKVEYGARTTAELNGVFEKAYPDFQDRTGWRMQSTYAPLPDDLRLEMQRFFKPYNEMLAGMGYDFAKKWDPSA